MAEGKTVELKILFWGTPDFAVPALRALLGEGHEVVGVVTQPDRPAGRGRALRASPVKQAALEEEIAVLQPERARGDEFKAQIQALAPDISVVIAYGQILKQDILDVPANGSINVHASLLPELRGAAPINWAIVRGYSETGVTVMRMVEQMDAGPIILQIPEPIGDDERASDLRDRLSEISAAAIVEALALIEAGIAVEIPQEDSKATYAPRINREDAHIDWTNDASDIERLIRGMDEIPGAWSSLRDTEIKLFRPLVVNDVEGEPGTIVQAHGLAAAEGILVACGTGGVWIREVQPSGKRRITAAEWVRGRGAEPGDRFR